MAPMVSGEIRVEPAPAQPSHAVSANWVLAPRVALLFSRNLEASQHWRKSQLNPLWRALRASAGYYGRFHSLRHYHLTQFATATGASLKEIMERGGHRNIQVAMKYQRGVGRELDLIELLG